ncbi:MAG TPA: PP2C family protein-serine/threonine phosphatase [Vicinamibacterales bacterium]|nr:PP2C family protein-serine/threonine phosphatase [Vicinamibacterales bacterium]
MKTHTVRAREIYERYSRDLSAEDLQRLFTHDTRDAYRFFARGVDQETLAHLPWWKRIATRAQQIFVAFTLKLPPARRALYLTGLVVALFGVVRLFRGFAMVEFPLGLPFVQVALALPVWADGTFALILSVLLLNFLVLLEVADRLSLKGELEVAREIQLAMLPAGTFRAEDIEICGLTRPANTVGGDFYDVLPLADGRVIVTLGDVAGKGSPAALLMALLLAVLRTLVDEDLDPPELMRRLNLQICRHSPGSRFITLFYAVYSPASGRLTYVNAGQTPPLIRRANGGYERLEGTGIALGMFERSTYGSAESVLSGGDTLVLYSDGITEAEDPDGRPFEEAGLEAVMATYGAFPAAEMGAETLRAVERHAHDSRFADDLTILILKRLAQTGPSA